MDRIIEEYKDINRNPISNCGVTIGLMNESDYTKWRVTLLGPKDSSYKGGLFTLSINFPNDYPNKPPEVCFLTPIYHVNVNSIAPKTQGEGVESLGHVCIECLNWWKPEYTMREVLTNIFALLCMPNPYSPYGLDRFDEFINERATYEEKARYFTKKYANPMRLFQEYDKNKEYDRNKDWNF